ncbi:hypothetical protein CEXT_5871 [Caerostris extrusa]|uniref:Uncharacterized protein n=1 Tax=Caerostris extrusa TaxID=172846 RepID=A0AAV4SU13_CAEEX|nr:hypothetical protein CEXT_5871 [Caerostris extrusa]
MEVFRSGRRRRFRPPGLNGSFHFVFIALIAHCLRHTFPGNMGAHHGRFQSVELALFVNRFLGTSITFFSVVAGVGSSVACLSHSKNNTGKRCVIIPATRTCVGNLPCEIDNSDHLRQFQHTFQGHLLTDSIQEAC